MPSGRSFASGFDMSSNVSFAPRMDCARRPALPKTPHRSIEGGSGRRRMPISKPRKASEGLPPRTLDETSKQRIASSKAQESPPVGPQPERGSVDSPGLCSVSSESRDKVSEGQVTAEPEPPGRPKKPNSELRKQQNRIASRNYREKRKRRLEKLDVLEAAKGKAKSRILSGSRLGSGSDAPVDPVPRSFTDLSVRGDSGHKRGLSLDDRKAQRRHDHETGKGKTDKRTCDAEEDPWKDELQSCREELTRTRLHHQQKERAISEAVRSARDQLSSVPDLNAWGILDDLTNKILSVVSPPVSRRTDHPDRPLANIPEVSE
jgi:hypothetical protein